MEKTYNTENTYNVRELAKYVINYSIDIGSPISNLKLQKLLYFIQAVFLMNENKICFEEEIQAWTYGPVVPVVYRDYRGFGSTNIYNHVKDYYFDEKTFDLIEEDFDMDKFFLSDVDKFYVDETIDEAVGLSAIDLVNITHNQSPWIEAYEKGENTIITPQSIKEFFTDAE